MIPPQDWHTGYSQWLALVTLALGRWSLAELQGSLASPLTITGNKFQADERPNLNILKDSTGGIENLVAHWSSHAHICICTYSHMNRCPLHTYTISYLRNNKYWSLIFTHTCTLMHLFTHKKTCVLPPTTHTQRHYDSQAFSNRVESIRVGKLFSISMIKHWPYDESVILNYERHTSGPHLLRQGG